MVEYYDLNETQYLFFSQQVTWDEARVLCNYYNAKLAILDTMEKATKVAELIADSNIGVSILHATSYCLNRYFCTISFICKLSLLKQLYAIIRNQKSRKIPGSVDDV